MSALGWGVPSSRKPRAGFGWGRDPFSVREAIQHLINRFNRRETLRAWLPAHLKAGGLGGPRETSGSGCRFRLRWRTRRAVRHVPFSTKSTSFRLGEPAGARAVAVRDGYSIAGDQPLSLSIIHLFVLGEIDAANQLGIQQAEMRRSSRMGLLASAGWIRIAICARKGSARHHCRSSELRFTGSGHGCRICSGIIVSIMPETSSVPNRDFVCIARKHQPNQEAL